MKKISLLIAIIFSLTCYGKVHNQKLDKGILNSFRRNLTNKEIISLKKKVFSLGGKSVPSLVTVIKSDKFPDKNRWVATMSLARIMGKKSSPFLVKFLRHPNWVLRLASMKSLLALGEKKYASLYAKALADKSFIVRRQALDIIKKMNLTQQAPYVWAMLYDKKNYYSSKKGSTKRTNLIKEAIRTIGHLKFDKAKKPLLKMIQKNKYKDIFSEMDYSLSMITGKKSPEGKRSDKRRFWKKIAIKNLVI